MSESMLMGCSYAEPRGRDNLPETINLPHLIPIASLNSEGVEHRWESSIFRGLLHNKLRFEFETYPPVGTWGGESNLALTCAEPAGHGTKLSCNL